VSSIWVGRRSIQHVLFGREKAAEALSVSHVRERGGTVARRSFRMAHLRLRDDCRAMSDKLANSSGEFGSWGYDDSSLVWPNLLLGTA